MMNVCYDDARSAGLALEATDCSFLHPPCFCNASLFKGPKVGILMKLRESSDGQWSSEWAVERNGRHHGLIRPLFAFRTVVRSHQHELAGLRGTTCAWTRHMARALPSPNRAVVARCHFNLPFRVTPYAAAKPTASTSSSHPENDKYSQPCTARLSGQWNGAAATMVSSNHFLLFVQVGPSQDYSAKRSSNYCLLLLSMPTCVA
ncbi:hypothetical protein MRX96_011775 [Rhipicephalus microplus]